MAIIGSLAAGGMKPTTPTIGTASDGGTGTSASVAFTPSSYIGKGTITYTATSSPGSITGTGSSSPITVSGLTTGTAYTFTVNGTTNYGVASASSAASNSVTPASPSSYESIATITATGGESSITFSSIPQTYKHLQIRAITMTGGGGGVGFRLNSDTGSNYARHYIQGNGTSASASGLASQTLGWIGATNSTSSYWNAFIFDLIDYTSTTKYKTTRAFSGMDSNGTGNAAIALYSSLWQSTSAVTDITLAGGNFTQTWAAGSTFALYGIKGA